LEGRPSDRQESAKAGWLNPESALKMREISGRLPVLRLVCLENDFKHRDVSIESHPI
jgi:hypothetical protein